MNNSRMKLGRFHDFLSCPYDHANLILDDASLKCSDCGRSFPVLMNTINFLAYEESFKDLIYDIPWHAVPVDRGISRMIARFRYLPVWWRLLFSGDYFSLFLERMIYGTINKASSVLDVGCREGKNLLLSKSSDVLIGIDIDFASVRYANRVLGLNGQAFLGSGTALPFRDEMFDLVLCTEVLEHIREADVVVNNLSRVCKRGGQLILSTPNGDIVSSPYVLHYKHFRFDELVSLFSDFFTDINVYSVVRNCRPRKVYWNLREGMSRYKCLLMPLNFLSNLLFLLEGYHKKGGDQRQDVTDANYILTAIRK